jgi:Tol biopolymer transport system component
MRFEVAGIVGKTRRLGIAVVLVVGLAAQVGVARAEEGSVGSAAISPANDAIAFTYCQHSAGCSLAEYDLASGEARILEKPDSESWFRPVYSPSGDRIAFSRSLKGAWSTEIAMIARDGSVTSLTDRRGFTEASSFSPDGQTLLFVRKRCIRRRSQKSHGAASNKLLILSNVQTPLSYRLRNIILWFWAANPRKIL